MILPITEYNPKSDIPKAFKENLVINKPQTMETISLIYNRTALYAIILLVFSFINYELHQ